MTLLYRLTAAPASQPRNAIIGQAVSMTIAISLAYATGLELWMRQSLAPALAIAVMTKLGVIHSPAGASALSFADGNLSWGNMAFMIVANLVAVAMAMLINNLSDKRQYPTYWGLHYLEELFQIAMRDAEKTIG